MTGPETGGPPSGPGLSGTPLSLTQRADNYRRQTGAKTPTARQARRLAHKQAHAERRGLVAVSTDTSRPQPTTPPSPVPAPAPSK